MKSINVDRRLKNVEKSILSFNLKYSGAKYVGRYYDELTKEERYQWLKYYYSLVMDTEPDIQAYEDVRTCFDTLHFICEKRLKPISHKEFIERIDFVREFMECSNYE